MKSLKTLVKEFREHRLKTSEVKMYLWDPAEMKVLLRAKGTKIIQHFQQIGGGWVLQVRYRGEGFKFVRTAPVSSLFPRKKRS